MKNISLLFLSLVLVNISLAQNPYKSIGKTTKPMLSLSNGKYVEHFESDSVCQIGSAIVNIYTEQIVAFVDSKEQASKTHSQTSSRFLSIDPLARNFPFLTPYQYASNTPIQAIDLDGLEAFKINTSSFEFFDYEEGKYKTEQTKQLLLTDISAKFKVVDENDVELNNFKYCSFACQMQNFYILNQIPTGDGGLRLFTPNITGQDKSNTENTFAITTKNIELVGFEADQIYSFYFGLGSVNTSNLEEKISNATQIAGIEVMKSKGVTEYNVNDDIKQFSILKIVNGTNAAREDIISNLKEQGFYHDNLNLEYSEAKEGDAGFGKMTVEYGNYECNSSTGCD